MRLNLSHSTLSESADYIHRYQKAAEALGVKPQILMDMKGPELRVGILECACELEDEVILCAQKIYTNLVYKQSGQKYIPVPQEVLDVLETGDEVLLDDGKLLIQIENKEFLQEQDIFTQIENREFLQEQDCVVTLQNDMERTQENLLENRRNTKKELQADLYITASVIRGGILQSGKSIKIKNKTVCMPPLTSHDIENIKVAKQYGVTALMQPFVLSGEDLRYVRSVLKEYHAEDIRIFAKIENRQGVANLSDILPEADVIIIARGDLGNDMPLWELPKVQKKMEAACKEQGVPYVVVTQMLASMEEHPVPTRAEVSDIYHAVYHGAWGVMVTGETAVGKYPVETITYLTNTAREAEETDLSSVSNESIVF